MTVFDRSTRMLVCAFCALFAPIGAYAQTSMPQETAAHSAAAETLAAPTTPTVASGCCVLADGTVVELEIAEPLSTKTAQRGQRFKLRLASSVRIGDAVALPAGIEGVGEVVHADRARAAGKPGELLLAARTLNGPNGEIKLRGFKFGGSGENRTTAAFWIPLGFFVRGGQVEVPAGARAHAKLAGAYTVPPTASAPSEPAPEPVPTAAPAEAGAETPQP